MSERVKITVDGTTHEVDGGELLIKAAEDNGTYIPRFCWHPRMNPVGMCRMCLVEVEGPRGTMLVPACTTPVNDGMVVHTESPVAKKAQEDVLEFLLINHPLDCPVCDKGGECPLQDQTMSHGPGESRFVEEKRHFEKPIPISDLVLLDRERCILCARCTRFSDEISGDPLIEFQERGNNTQVLTFPDEPFASYFSGNTVQICPVGALTATAYRFRARPWDLRAVGSTCMHCTVGESITVQSSQNEILRFLGVDNDATNHGWLSDKCRFGFEYINSAERLETPQIRGESGALVPATWAEALQAVAAGIGGVIERDGGGAVAALGGARGTNEEAYALAKFMRVAIGSNHLDAQMDDGLDPQFLAALAGRGTIDDLERAKTILVWGPDLKEELGTLYLRVRRAAQELGATLIVVHPRATGLDDRASHKFTYKPGTGPDVLRRLVAGVEQYAPARAALNEGPVVAIVGRTGYSEDPRLAEAVAAFVRDLPDASVLPVVRRGNTYGALDMGVAPSLLPGRVRVGSDAFDEWSAPDEMGKDAAGILNGLLEGTVKAVFLVGADPVADVPGGNAADALDAAEFVVSIDTFINESNRHADVVFPALAATEKEGTVTNLEGRVQKVNRVVPGPGQAREDWSILDDVATVLERPIHLASAEAIMKEIAAVAPAYRGITWDLVTWDNPDGVVVPIEGSTPLEYVPVDAGLESREVPLALHTARTMYDDGVLMRHGLSLHTLAPGAAAYMTRADATGLGVAEGSTVSVNDHELPVVFDDTLAPGTLYVPFNQPGSPNVGDHLGVRLKVMG